MADDKTGNGGVKGTNDGEEVSGKAKGGFARAAALSKGEKISIARKAAMARWAASKPLTSIKRGNFKADFGIDVDCFVLNDEQKTAVISQRGIGDVLGLRGGGRSLPRFLGGRGMAPHVGSELAEKMANPLIFQVSTLVPNMPPVVVHGYDVTMLIDICKAVVSADGKVAPSLVKQAHVILNASAKAGIKGLVYALAGYDQTKEEVIAAFKFYVLEEAREYEKEFPPQLYQEWYRLYGVYKPQRGKSWKFRHLTVDQVYWPLARSNGKVLELARAQKAKSDDRWAKLHQFLSEIGVKALRTHLGRLLGMAEASRSKDEYEGHVERIFGKQTSIDFTSASAPSRPSLR
jgi:P63C domain-containing protein